MCTASLCLNTPSSHLSISAATWKPDSIGNSLPDPCLNSVAVFSAALLEPSFWSCHRLETDAVWHRFKTPLWKEKKKEPYFLGFDEQLVYPPCLVGWAETEASTWETGRSDRSLRSSWLPRELYPSLTTQAPTSKEGGRSAESLQPQSCAHILAVSTTVEQII